MHGPRTRPRMMACAARGRPRPRAPLILFAIMAWCTSRCCPGVRAFVTSWPFAPRPGSLVLSPKKGAQALLAENRVRLGAANPRMPLGSRSAGPGVCRVHSTAAGSGGGGGSELLVGLNEAQRAAVVAPPGPMIVLAGPGSGKTRVLTNRIAYLMRQHGATPESIVAVTFTNKASKEMRERVKRVLGIQHDSELQVTVGTFHKVCLMVLREHGHLLGLQPNFLIFDADQQKELVVQAMGELGISTETMQPNTLRFAIGNLKSQNLSPDQAADFQERGGAAWNPKFATTVQQVYKHYQKALQLSNAVDFDDILIDTLRLMQQFPEVTAELQQRWQHILVDEWQVL